MKKIRKAARELFLLPVKFYRKCISPHTRPSCKYYPTCSTYCMQAVREWGIFCGFFLTVWRILRCNPFSKGGYDPVPKRRRKKKADDSGDNRENNQND